MGGIIRGGDGVGHRQADRSGNRGGAGYFRDGCAFGVEVGKVEIEDGLELADDRQGVVGIGVGCEPAGRGVGVADGDERRPDEMADVLELADVHRCIVGRLDVGGAVAVGGVIERPALDEAVQVRAGAAVVGQPGVEFIHRLDGELLELPLGDDGEVVGGVVGRHHARIGRDFRRQNGATRAPPCGIGTVGGEHQKPRASQDQPQAVDDRGRTEVAFRLWGELHRRNDPRFKEWGKTSGPCTSGYHHRVERLSRPPHLNSLEQRYRRFCRPREHPNELVRNRSNMFPLFHCRFQIGGQFPPMLLARLLPRCTVPQQKTGKPKQLSNTPLLLNRNRWHSNYIPWLLKHYRWHSYQAPWLLNRHRWHSNNLPSLSRRNRWHSNPTPLLSKHNRWRSWIAPRL